MGDGVGTGSQVFSRQERFKLGEELNFVPFAHDSTFAENLPYHLAGTKSAAFHAQRFQLEGTLHRQEPILFNVVAGDDHFVPLLLWCYKLRPYRILNVSPRLVQALPLIINPVYWHPSSSVW